MIESYHRRGRTRVGVRLTQGLDDSLRRHRVNAHRATEGTVPAATETLQRVNNPNRTQSPRPIVRPGSAAEDHHARSSECLRQMRRAGVIAEEKASRLQQCRQQWDLVGAADEDGDLGTFRAKRGRVGLQSFLFMALAGKKNGQSKRIGCRFQGDCE